MKAGTYSRIRVEFERVEASVQGELRLRLGAVNGQVDVNLGSDSRVVVERELAFSADARTRTRIAIGLNARQWLESASARAGTVSEAEFRSAVQIAAHAH